MKLIVHMGLHKTASTFFQHVCNANHAALADAGLWYAPQEGYPAHHHAAWAALAGQAQPLMAMIADAREAGCHTVLFSSEDMEGALYDQRPLDAVGAAARLGEIDTVEWHAVLRDPGSCFASLFAQLQHHVYADALSLFHSAMRRGFVHMAEPVPDDGTPYWYYSFDTHRDLARLAARTGERLFAHDFTDAHPFPGWRILAREGVLEAVGALPGPEARNARLDSETVVQGYAARMSEAVPEAEDQQAICDAFTTALGNSMQAVETCARLVGERFAHSHARTLAEFAVPADQDTPAMSLARS